MKEFSALPKMKSDVKCYKEGGSVYKSRHSETAESSQDVAQDKKIVKKAFSMHDKQEHEGSKTDLSKLRRGGRAKKETGTVNKFKCGGTTKVKPTGDKKADAPSKAVAKGKELPKFKDGGVTKVKPKVVKLADGGMPAEMQQQVQDARQQRASGAAYNAATTYPETQDALGGLSDAERAVLAKIMARRQRPMAPSPMAPAPVAPQRPPMPAAPPRFAEGGAIPMGGVGSAQPPGGMGLAQPSDGMGLAQPSVMPQPGLAPAPGAMQPQQQGLIRPYRPGF
jgi:hypothetical protein